MRRRVEHARTVHDGLLQRIVSGSSSPGAHTELSQSAPMKHVSAARGFAGKECKALNSVVSVVNGGQAGLTVLAPQWAGNSTVYVTLWHGGVGFVSTSVVQKPPSPHCVGECQFP